MYWNENPDVLVANNNGTWAMKLSDSGRLARMIETNDSGRQRCWLFGSFFDKDLDQNGNEVQVPNFDRRGRLMGSRADLETFILALTQAGFTYASRRFWVPHSSGANNLHLDTDDQLVRVSPLPTEKRLRYMMSQLQKG